MRVVFSLTISSFLTQLIFINLSPVNNQQIRLSFGVGNVGLVSVAIMMGAQIMIPSEYYLLYFSFPVGNWLEVDSVGK
jgi:hypothetical protein